MAAKVRLHGSRMQFMRSESAMRVLKYIRKELHEQLKQMRMDEKGKVHASGYFNWDEQDEAEAFLAGDCMFLVMDVDLRKRGGKDGSAVERIIRT